MKYLVAFAGKPMPTFLPTIVDLAAKDGVEIKGAVLSPGPGCYNLAIIIDENARFMDALTMALMPARYSTTEDARLVEGEFKDWVYEEKEHHDGTM